MAQQRSQRNGGDKEKGSPPEWSRRLWTGSANIEVAVFAKEVKGDNGDFVAYNVSAKRTYKEGEEYKSTQGFRSDDVPALVSLLLQAHAYVTDQLNKS